MASENKKIKSGGEERKSKYISQSDVPKHRIEKAIEVPEAIWDNFAGHPTTPIRVASAMDISPTSSNWQELPGSAVAYGLTTGSYNAPHIALTDLGKRVVAPKVEGDEKKAIIEAILKPRILREFYTQYNKAKFPKDSIAINVIVDWGVPPAKAEQVLNIIKENGRYAGILKEIKGNTYIVLDGHKMESANQNTEEENPDDRGNGEEDELGQSVFNKPKVEDRTKQDLLKAEVIPEKARVFISHGKNKKILDQLKEILRFGQFEVMVSIEKETTAIPVPEKVFSDMKACNAAVIHIEGEEKFVDQKGNEHLKLNENVLIEIGAAMALYGKKFVLLCEKSVTLPSNLQGIYRCEYEGTELNYESTLKLLKTFNEFRNN